MSQLNYLALLTVFYILLLCLPSTAVHPKLIIRLSLFFTVILPVFIAILVTSGVLLQDGFWAEKWIAGV